MSADQVCLSKDDIDKPWDIAWAYTSYITPYVRNGRAIVVTILLASLMEGKSTTSAHTVAYPTHKDYTYTGVVLSLLAFSTMTIM